MRRLLLCSLLALGGCSSESSETPAGSSASQERSIDGVAVRAGVSDADAKGVLTRVRMHPLLQEQPDILYVGPNTNTTLESTIEVVLHDASVPKADRYTMYMKTFQGGWAVERVLKTPAGE